MALSTTSDTSASQFKEKVKSFFSSVNHRLDEKLGAETELPEGEFQVQTSDRFPRRFGIVVLVITFGVFGLWAAFAPLDSAALAPGTVTVKNYRRTVQHLEGGIVREILVTEGQHVDAMEPLLIMDTTQSGAELDILRGQYFALSAIQSRLIAERNDLDTILLPEDLNSATDARAQEAIQNETALFEARRQWRHGQIEVLEQRIVQLQSQITGLNSLITSKQDLIASYSEEIAELNDLLSEGYIDKMRLTDVKRSRTRTQGEVAEHQASVGQIHVRIGESRLEIAQMSKEFQTDVIDELGKVQASLFDTNERIRTLQYRVARAVVKAPIAGRVLGLKTHTVGGVIQSGAPLLDIVPANEELIVEAKVAPMDIDRVSIGTTADIRFSAFKSASTPVIKGVLTNISADSLIDEQTGFPYYLARVEITSEGRELLGDLKLVPGMPAEVLLKTGERTLLEYIIQPATNIFARSLIED